MDTVEVAQQAIDEILAKIIDEWYDNVSSFYVTAEAIEEDSTAGSAELKRFHDEKGHRIKFNKDELDFTYGLRSYWQDGALRIEVSVNNKVANFDYDDFSRRLNAHYRKTGGDLVQTPYELRNSSFGDVFGQSENFGDNFTVEIREDKADIMGLSFQLCNQYLDKLVEHPVSGKELIECYCVTPFRKIYATVYRTGS